MRKPFLGGEAYCDSYSASIVQSGRALLEVAAVTRGRNLEAAPVGECPISRKGHPPDGAEDMLDELLSASRDLLPLFFG